MRFYSLNDLEVLQMPVNRFWLLERNATRISAQEDLRALNVAAASGSGEGCEELYGSLSEVIGTTLVKAPTLDRSGLEALRNM
tara:strand:- start:7 stop:255 length:249 start_codon:yes stop_codon:yes gene_type:complete